jgi:hypothetical protein
VENVQTPFTETLVPLDGSVTAERALTPALELWRPLVLLGLGG